MRRVPLHAACLSLVSILAALSSPWAGEEAATLENLRAFAKLYGCVKYFHPSDEASEIDWDRFALYGARQARHARTKDQLRRTLENLFLPIAPTIQIYSSESPPSPAPPVTGDAARLKTVAWQHRGVGLGNPRTPYKSLRVNGRNKTVGGPLDDLIASFFTELFPQIPKVGEAVTVSLLRGLSARVPLVLYSDGEHTLGGNEAHLFERLESALAAGGPDTVSVLDPDVRLGDVVIAWNVFQRFYPYLDVAGTNWDSVLTSSLGRALSDSSAELFQETLRLMVAQLHDGHGTVSMESNVEEAYLPLAVQWIEEQVVIVATADSALFKRGDIVLSLDGVAAKDKTLEAESFISGSPQWKRWVAMQRFGLGRKGSEAKLLILREGGTIESLARRTLKKPPAEPRPVPVSKVGPGITYVDLTAVEVTSLKSEIKKLKQARGLIFDLRGYPRRGAHDVLRHLTDHTLQSARWQIPQIIYPDQVEVAGYDTSGRWNLSPKEPRLGGKIVFLTNAGAISYGESVLGIVEHYKLGEIVGQPTAGANGNVNPFTLPGGFRISWTGMRVIKHDGSRHHLVGIRPTVPVSRTIRAVRQGRDEDLEKALELIRGSFH